MNGRSAQKIFDSIWIRTLLLCVLLIMIGTGLMKTQAVSNVETDEVIMRGIDVSRWQGKINWKKVKKAGIQFAMIGMGRVYRDGTTFLDPTFDYNVRKANANGIRVGVYLYSLAKTKAQAKKEAEWVIEHIDGYKISFPVAFDMEDPSVQGVSASAKASIALSFLKTVKSAGYYPIMYASENWFKTGVNLARLTAYDKWVARWSEGMTFSPVSIWQYSSKGKVNGIAADVDLDYCYKNYASLIKPRTHSKKVTAKAGWYHSGSDYWYVKKNGTTPVSKFLTVGSKTYYLDQFGNRVTGWKKIKKQYYYFDSKGRLQKGWFTVGDNRYYSDPQTGVRVTGFATIEGKTYYMDPEASGAMATGWKEIEGKWYLFEQTTGVMYKSTTYEKYKFDKNGVCVNYSAVKTEE